MGSKKWFVSLISITMLIILLFGALQYYLDPLLQYGGERGPLTYRRYDDLYCNSGIAKNYDYNAVLLGSSIAVNTDINVLNGLFDCKTIKVTFSGATSYNHKKILDICYSSGNQIDKVFWTLDEFALTADVDSPRWPLPEYLYDDSVINDISYLLNLDVFYYYTLFDIKKTIAHQTDTLMFEGNWDDDESIYCKENVLASLASFPKRQYESKGEQYYETLVLENLENNILPFIKGHPETEFNFFMVPYSVFFWYFTKSEGTLDAHMYDVRIVLGKLLEYNNVKVHFFQGNEEIITNLDLYKDYTHYKHEINDWMSEEMKKGSYLLTKETYNQTIDRFYDYLSTFNYDEFYYSQMNN